MKKNKLCFYLASIGFVSLIILGNVFTFGLYIGPKYTKTYLNELNNKIERLKENHSNRIIAIGGSAIPFGLNTELIENNLESTTFINFGLNAALGTKIMLDIVEKEIKPGDKIIIMPEMDPQTLSLFFSPLDYLQAIDGNFDNLKYVKKENLESLINALPVFGYEKIKFINKELRVGGIYQKASFNEYGDIKFGLRENNIMRNGYNPSRLIDISISSISNSFIEYMNTFNALANKAKAEVYYYFSPMNDKAIDKKYTLNQIDDFYNYLYANLNFPIIGNPHDSIIDSHYFYDTNFHLNDVGMRLYTKKFVDNIKLLNKDRTPTNIEVPPMPPYSKKSGDGDNSCSDKFTYIKDNDEEIINSLIDKSLKEVIIPYRHNDIYVNSFTKDTFKNNQNITKIIIQDNITFIDDASFSGSSLKELHILNKIPNTISIGKGLLEGANFKIYVPNDSLDTYLTDYSWGIYAPYIFGE